MIENTYIKNSGMPLRYVKEIALCPSVSDEKAFIELKGIKENIKDFVNNGENLLICSNNAGNGKTSWATKLIKAYIDSVKDVSFRNNTPALFVNVNSFINEKKLGISDPAIAKKVNSIERNILTAKLVVFDDIGDKNLSEYDSNLLYYWIDYRTANLKSCIYTSNQLPEQLKTTLSGKVYSRVVNYSKIIKFTDGDHREC